jgi:uncharacterized membrane protein
MRSSIRQDTPGTGRTQRVRTAVCVAAALALLAACNDEPSGLDAGADGPPVVVTAAQPRESGRGETMKVTITGSGFRQGDEAVWERDGNADDRVVVESTEFVSESQLIATISVQADAPAASYDIAVDRPRKRGIGTEAFYVLHGIGAEFQARFSFTYDGYRSDSFNVDHTFVLDPATMDPGSWGLTYYVYEQHEQFLGAHYLRDDGLVDMMWCWVPGGRVSAPGTRELECWFTPQYNFETGEYADPEDYTSFIGSDRPGDGTGRVTFTSVTPERLAGTFSITMHVADWPDWLGSPTITISDGEFDLPVVSSYYDRGEEKGGEGGGSGPPPDVRNSRALAINDRGVVVGWAYNEKAEMRAVRWVVFADGQVSGPEELGTLAGSTHQWPTGINNQGVITGYGWPAGQSVANEIAFIHGGTMRALTPPDGARTTRAFGINEQGVVVGWSEMPGLGLRGPVWLNPLDPDDRPIQLPAPTGSTASYGLHINNNGVIAGFSAASGPNSVLWQLDPGGTASGPNPTGLGGVNALNDGPDFLGGGQETGAGLLRAGSFISLGPLPGHGTSVAYGLNNPLPGHLVTVVGGSGGIGPGTPGSTPVVWSVDAAGAVAGPIELGLVAGYAHAEPTAVNAHGWIAGTAHNGQMIESAAALWLPLPGTGYQVIRLGGLFQTAASYRAAGASDVVSTGRSRCRARPGRPDRCR